MTKKAEGREMTPGEIAADQAHRDAHARAIAEEKQRNELIKERIAAGDIEPGVPPDQLDVTPQAPRRAPQSVPTTAEDFGGARGPTPPAAPAETPTRSHSKKE